MNTVETEQLTMTLLTIKELLEEYAPNLAAKVEELSAKGLIKTDGAVDEIPNRKNKNIMPLSLARIIEEVQRVDDIEVTKIIENLTRCGGFSHKYALVGDVFGFESEEYKSGTDTMHRWIMAYLCGVTEVAINEQDVHSVNDSIEAILLEESEAFNARNKFNSKVSDTSKERVAKTTGTWNTAQQAKHETLKRVNIHINAYGSHVDSAYYVFKTWSEFEKLITSPNNPCYVETDTLKDTIEYFQDGILDKGIENYPKLFGALCVVRSKHLKGNKEKGAFTTWLEDKSSSGFKSYNENFWGTRVQHTRNMEQTALRILCAYNQWRRNQLKKNVIDISDLQSLINPMNVETNQFVQDCLISEIPIKYDPIINLNDEDDDDTLDETFGIK